MKGSWIYSVVKVVVHKIQTPNVQKSYTHDWLFSVFHVSGWHPKDYAFIACLEQGQFQHCDESKPCRTHTTHHTVLLILLFLKPVWHRKWFQPSFKIITCHSVWDPNKICNRLSDNVRFPGQIIQRRSSKDLYVPLRNRRDSEISLCSHKSERASSLPCFVCVYVVVLWPLWHHPVPSFYWSGIGHEPCSSTQTHIAHC